MNALKKNGGFTLVELIVVIAVLAILAGVAVPAYSGYVTKANKQADMTLVSEIENALMLAHYSGDLDKAGWVVLSVDKDVNTSGDEITNAMKAAFGDDYAKALRLSYSGWETLNFSDLGLDAETAGTLVDSSFLSGNSTNGLLENVASMTGSLGTVLGGTGKKAALIRLMNNSALGTVCSQMGIDTTGENWQNNLSETELANLTVLAIAQEYSTWAATEGNDVNKLADDDNGLSTVTKAVTLYAICVGHASSEYATDAEKQRFNTLVNNLSDLNVPTDESDNPGSASDYILDLLGKYISDLGEEGSTYESYEENKATGDLEALLKIMGSLSNGTSSGMLNADDLKDGQLLTDGKLGRYYDQYVGAAYALSNGATLPTMQDGEVIIFFDGKSVCSSIG